MILTQEELIELTNRSRPSAQIKVLRHMCIEHRVRPDGSIVVLRHHVEQVLGGEPYKTSKPKEPNWRAL
jgi:hypothetical protein